MLNNLLARRNNLIWMLFHVFLGVLCVYSKWFLIIWFYLFILLNINKVITNLFNNNVSDYLLPFITYLSTFEVLGRMVKSYPYLPWELSKYILLFCTLFLLIIRRINSPHLSGLLLILLLVPGILIDQSNRVGLPELISNLLGPLSMCGFMICFANLTISNVMLNNLLRIIWLTVIPVLVFSIIQTPDFKDISFQLGAVAETAGGFGSNQVSSVLGLGMFLSYYAWMNKLLFTGIHSLDGIFIGLFAYQGLMTFSRGGILVGLIAMLIYYILFRSSGLFKEHIRKKSLRPLLFFGFALMIFSASYVIIENRSEGQITLRYLGETFGTLSGNKIKTIDTFTTGRYEILKSDLLLWNENFIFGTGAGSSKYLRSGVLYGISPHTELTRLLAEHGLFGLLFIFIIIVNSMKSFKRNKNSIYQSILITLFLIGIGTAFHSAMRTFITPVLVVFSLFNVFVDEDE